MKNNSLTTTLAAFAICLGASACGQPEEQLGDDVVKIVGSDGKTDIAEIIGTAAPEAPPDSRVRTSKEEACFDGMRFDGTVLVTNLEKTLTRAQTQQYDTPAIKLDAGGAQVMSLSVAGSWFQSWYDQMGIEVYLDQIDDAHRVVDYQVGKKCYFRSSYDGYERHVAALPYKCEEVVLRNRRIFSSVELDPLKNAIGYRTPDGKTGSIPYDRFADPGKIHHEIFVDPMTATALAKTGEYHFKLQASCNGAACLSTCETEN